MSKFYDRREWRDVIQPAQLARQPLCEDCKERGLVTAAAHVDHVIPISKGGDPRDTNNLRSLCRACHSRKTAQDEGKAVAMGCTADGVPLARRARTTTGRGEVQTLAVATDERHPSLTHTSTKPKSHVTA